MSEYVSKKAVLEWLDDRRYKSPWIESFRERLESGAFDIQAAADQDIKTAMTRELTDERVATAAAYWLDASPHERWEPDGIVLARYARYAMTEIERLRAALEDIRYQIQQSDHPSGLGILATINQALSTTTEPTGARREICPDHSDEKPQISSSHTWTQDGNTYFVSYVEYCPTCYHVISTSARL